VASATAAFWSVVWLVDTMVPDAAYDPLVNGHRNVLPFRRRFPTIDAVCQFT
jgi:hypothetical protein